MKFKYNYKNFDFPYNNLSQEFGVIGEEGQESCRYENEYGIFVNLVFPLYGEITAIPIEYLE